MAEYIWGFPDDKPVEILLQYSIRHFPGTVTWGLPSFKPYFCSIHTTALRYALLAGAALSIVN